MQQTWACALYAAGADIFASHHGLDPDVDPFSAIGGERGVSLTHDEQPPSGRIDAIVLSELQHTNDGWRLPGRILKPACPPTVLPGRAFGGPSGVLDTMVAALRDIGLTLGLEIPTDVGWRNLLSARSIAEGLDRLARTGRAQIKKAEPLPSNLLH